MAKNRSKICGLCKMSIESIFGSSPPLQKYQTFRWMQSKVWSCFQSCVWVFRSSNGSFLIFVVESGLKVEFGSGWVWAVVKIEVSVDLSTVEGTIKSWLSTRFCCEILHPLLICQRSSCFKVYTWDRNLSASLANCSFSERRAFAWLSNTAMRSNLRIRHLEAATRFRALLRSTWKKETMNQMFLSFYVFPQIILRTPSADDFWLFDFVNDLFSIFVLAFRNLFIRFLFSSFSTSSKRDPSWEEGKTNRETDMQTD